MTATLPESTRRTPGTSRLGARSRLQFAALLLAFALLVRLPVFFYPFFNGDEATYRAVANALLDGKWLYAEAVDHKPPMIYATYALVLGLFGRYHTHAIHLLSILAVFLTGLLVSVIGNVWGLSRQRSRLAGLIFVGLATLGPGKDMLAANGEIFMLVPTASAILLLGVGENRPTEQRLAWIASSGFMVGVAALFKYQAAATLLPIAIQILRHRSVRKSNSFPVLTWGVLAVGFLALPVVLVAPWGLSGRFSSLLFWAWRYPLTYAGKLSVAEMLSNLVQMTPQWAVPALPLLLISFAATRTLRKADCPVQRSLATLGTWWLISAAIGVAAGGRFFLHYYLQLVPAVALLSAAYRPRRPWVIRVALAYSALFLASFWVANALDHKARPRLDRYTRTYVSIGQWVRGHSNAGDRLLVWGNSPEIYHFSERGMGTRFPFCNYHSGKIWGTKFDDEAAVATEQGALAEAWPMLIEDLDSRRPQLIVDAAAAGLDRWRGHEVFRYPRLWTLVQRDYREIATVAGATIYRRSSP